MAARPNDPTKNDDPSLAARSIVQERTFDAPRALVFRAFTEREHLDQWWGPNGYRNQSESLELRVGGEWRFVMNGPDGKVWVNWIRYEEIHAPERLVYSHGGDDPDEAQMRVTVRFEEQGGRTKVTMTSVFASAEVVEAVKKFGAIEGGQQTLARLAGFLPHLADDSASRSMVLSRLISAPRARVFEAWSVPEAMTRWWGPKGFTAPEVTVDFRVDGAYRIVMRDPADAANPVRGTYLEIVPGRRIVFESFIEAMDDFYIVTTVTFDDDASGKTLLTVVQERLATPEEAAGQFEGWSTTLDKLAPVVES